jgi:hypothetical protein
LQYQEWFVFHDLSNRKALSRHYGPQEDHQSIKGNVNRQGERIYHLPGQGTYAKINMEDPRKRWFCSEDDARAAGWRPAKR